MTVTGLVRLRSEITIASQPRCPLPGDSFLIRVYWAGLVSRVELCLRHGDAADALIGDHKRGAAVHGNLPEIPEFRGRRTQNSRSYSALTLRAPIPVSDSKLNPTEF